MKRILTALVLGLSLLVVSGGGGYAQDFGFVCFLEYRELETSYKN